MKNIKWVIIFVAILSVILLCLIIFLPQNKKDNNIEEEESNKSTSEQNNNELKSAEELGIVVPDNANEEIGYIEFYTVSNCISRYLDALVVKTDQNDNEDSNKKIQEEIKALTSSKSNNVSNVLQEKEIFIPIDILLKKNSTVQSYVAYGIIANLDMKYKTDAYYIVNLDTLNKTFSIEPLDERYTSIGEITVEELESVEKNDYNEYTEQKLTNEYKYKQLFNEMKRLMLVKPELAYERLDEDYKTERFGNYEEFEDYITRNRDHLIKITPKKYETLDDNILILADQYGNKYEFNITGTMKYTAKIDDYIVLFDNDVDNYKKASNEDKAKFNIKRWIKMLNSKDYKFAYEYLDETFKEENYSTLDDFSQAIESKYTEIYDNVSINLKENGNVYVAEVELKVSGEDYSEKYITIIIKLEDDTDFTLSFDKQ